MNPDIHYLVENYSDMIFRFIMKIVGDRDVALDLTQDTFLRLLEKPGCLENAENPKGYLLKMAWHRALNFARNERAHRLKECSYCSMENLHAPDPEAALKNAEQASRIRRFMNDLSPKQREAVVCRFYGDMKFTAIARELKVNEATVRMHLKRALEKLKSAMTAE